MTEYSPAKTGEYPRIFPNFQSTRCKKDLKDNKDNSRHLGRKYARIFVLGHYLFLVALSFPRASLSENCSLLGTDNVRGQISEHIFAPNGDYCLYNRLLLTQHNTVQRLLIAQCPVYQYINLEYSTSNFETTSLNF